MTMIEDTKSKRYERPDFSAHGNKASTAPAYLSVWNIESYYGESYIVQDISFNEAGGGEFGLAVTSATYEEFCGTASLDLIGRFGEDGQQVRPSLGVHVRQVFTDDAPQFVGTFLNSPAGSFAVNGSLDETEYGVNAGLAVALFDNRATLSAGYRGTFSSNNSAHQGNVRLVVPF